MIISPSLIPSKKASLPFSSYADKVPAEVLALGSAAVPDVSLSGKEIRRRPAWGPWALRPALPDGSLSLA
jgi:hypothetical protein